MNTLNKIFKFLTEFSVMKYINIFLKSKEDIKKLDDILED